MWGLLVGVPACLLFVVGARALTVRMATGRWPHQHEVARRLYEDLP